MGGMFGHHQGQVVDRNDPDGIGRIRVFIPGIFESPDYSGWIKPFGLFDAVEGRGFFIVPSMDAMIMIVFLYGDALKTKNARYIVGPWGAPAGVTDVPSEAQVGGVVSPDISVMAFNGFAIVVDERDTFKKATLLDRTNGSFIRLDIEAQSIDFSSVLNFNKTVGQDENTDITGDKIETISGSKTCDTVTSDEKTAASKKSPQPE
ncbi:unnamed protein product, partial [marine sediment metagenome]